ncbi:MAG: hypothetical protein OEY94_09255 [Alphaproteobacteria bacterium]|nr:hypothetical protein [Alphaproteobacteria bacterium]
MDFKLFNAILSMDSYNRGYGASIDLRPRDAQGNFILDPENNNQPTASDKNGTKIGVATISNNSSSEFGGGVDAASGFYALSYDVQGTGTIISYRGTDNPVGSIPYIYTADSGCDIR